MQPPRRLSRGALAHQPDVLVGQSARVRRRRPPPATASAGRRCSPPSSPTSRGWRTGRSPGTGPTMSVARWTASSCARGYDARAERRHDRRPRGDPPPPAGQRRGARSGALDPEHGRPRRGALGAGDRAPGRRARHRAPGGGAPPRLQPRAARPSCAGCSRRVSGRGTWPSTATWWPARWGSSSPAAAAAIRRSTPPSPTAAAGICSRLLVDAARHAVATYGATRLVIVADPDYHAAGIYESVGFRPWSGSAGCAGRLPPIGAPARTARPRARQRLGQAQRPPGVGGEVEQDRREDPEHHAGGAEQHRHRGHLRRRPGRGHAAGLRRR